jgi:Na+/melibiose symporter-like transporter
LILLVFVITQVADRSIPLVALIVMALAAVALLVGFVINEMRSSDPLLPLSIFRLRTLRNADIASLTVLSSPFAYSFIVTLYTQEVLGYSPLQTGLALLPGAVLSALVSWYVAPRLIQRIGLRLTGVIGLLLVAVGFLMLLHMGVRSSYLSLLFPSSMVCLGLGMGTAYPIFTIGGVTGVKPELQGMAAGIQQTALQVGGGFGLAMVSTGVAAHLGSSTDAHSYVDALHLGVLIGTAVPVLGAAIAFFGLPPKSDTPAAQENSS